MREPETFSKRGQHAADELGLQALAWTLADDERARRLLAVTGLDPADLRARAGESSVLAACLGFLESHEPDLIACAAALDCPPAALVDAHRSLEQA